MDLDKIWQDIKSDQSEIYGMKMLDAFLMLTKDLDSEHFDELNPQQKQKINADVALNILVVALINDSSGELFKQRVKEIGIGTISKLSTDQVGYILSNMIANTDSLEPALVLGDNLRKLNNVDYFYNRDELSSLSTINSLLKQTQIKHNKNGMEKLSQLLSIFRKYDLLDYEKDGEELLYFIGTNEVPMKVFEEELKKMNMHDIGEILVHTITKFGRLPLNDFVQIMINRIKELKKIFGEKIKTLFGDSQPSQIGASPAIQVNNIKAELEDRGLLNVWDDIKAAIQSL